VPDQVGALDPVVVEQPDDGIGLVGRPEAGAQAQGGAEAEQVRHQNRAACLSESSAGGQPGGQGRSQAVQQHHRLEVGRIVRPEVLVRQGVRARVGLRPHDTGAPTPSAGGRPAAASACRAASQRCSSSSAYPPATSSARISQEVSPPGR